MPDGAKSDPSWQRIEELFLAAIDLPSAEREAFLDRECEFDIELRQEAEALLAADDSSGQSIATILEDTAASLFDRDAGKRFGPYQVVREIGRGGMGAVYLALRADHAFERRVAIKVVKRGVDTDAVLGRFRHERRILAGLDHPYIARLIDGGTSGDDRPYFVMEYVEGKPIQEFCQGRSLTIRDRCELFRRVCEPVAYAHRNLVIHRDLKPANILVAGEGSPKLLDFGIARLLSLDPGENTLGPDAASSSALTPAYASPEQRRGEAVTTATDVYSLGAVLFEILTGLMPPCARNVSVERTIGKPSEAVEDGVLRGQLAGDLDNIVLKATHPEPERRYQSVDHLSEDLQRFLTGRPVLAREDSFRYRAGKFIRRHRFAVMGAVALALGITAGVIAVLWEARQAHLQRQRAEQRVGQMVELANRTLFDVHGAIERLPGATEARKQIVGATLDYLDQLAREAANDTRVQSALASAYFRVAEIKGYPTRPNLGDLPGALETYHKSAKILETLIAADPRNGGLKLRLADVDLGIGAVLFALGRQSESVATLNRGIAIVDAALARDPNKIVPRRLASELHQKLAQILIYRDPAMAEQQLLKQLPLDIQVTAEIPNDPDALLALANDYSLLGMTQSRQNRIDKSLQYYGRTVELREKVVGLRPRDVSAQRELMMAYGHVGDSLGSPFLASLGNYAEATESYRKAARIAESMAAADPADKLAQRDLGVVYLRMGTVMASDSQIAESLQTLDRAASILEVVVAAAPKDTGNQIHLAMAYEYKGERLKRLQQYRQALSFYRRSFALASSVFTQNPDNRPAEGQVIAAGEGLSFLLAMLGERAEAVGAVSRMLAAAKHLAAAQDTLGTRAHVARALAAAGDSYNAMARSAADRDAALNYYRQAREIWARFSAGELKPYRRDFETLEQRIARIASN